MYKNIINTELLALRMLCKGCYRDVIMHCISFVFSFFCRRRKRFKYPTCSRFLNPFVLFFKKKKKKERERERNREKTLRFKKYLKTCERSVNDTVNVIWNTDRRPVCVASSTDLCFGHKDSNKPGKTAVANNSHICL